MNAKTDSAYKFGCGRYIQQHGALDLAGREARRLGNHALILGGSNTLPLVRKKLTDSLAAAACTHACFEYGGPCSEEAAQQYAAICTEQRFDLVIGAGGGRIMDLAKLTAALAGLPVMNIPTSSATCAAYTPLSVIYTPEGQARGSWYLEQEVACILADMDILCAQPRRLAFAGIMDASAKHVEIAYHLRHGLTKAADTQSAAVLAKTLYDQLISANMAHFDRESDTACWNMVYLCIAVTGMISGLARGAFQSALGHAFYEAVRTMWPRESASALHGEIVAVGLLIQETLDEQTASLRELRDFMTAAQMPTTLHELGLPTATSDVGALLELPFFSPYADSGREKCLEKAVYTLLSYEGR